MSGPTSSTNNPDFHGITVPAPPTLCPRKREGAETINQEGGGGGSILHSGDN